MFEWESANTDATKVGVNRKGNLRAKAESIKNIWHMDLVKFTLWYIITYIIIVIIFEQWDSALHAESASVNM